MTKRSRRRPSPNAQQGRRGTVSRWLPIALGVLALGVAGVLLLRSQPTSGQVAWTRFSTQDAHSLAFVAGDPRHLLFGHHGGLSESQDGGRSWTALPVRDDAMSTAPAGDGSIVIAGHEVFAVSRDGGATWSRITSDLPNHDIHGFTRDPTDPARMWAYLATGGLWESGDLGLHWTRVREDNVLFPLAVRVGSTMRLVGVDATGLVASDDGGRSWMALATPETYPMTSLAATPDGRVMYAGSLDGLFRTTDGGRSWAPTTYTGSALAVATTADGGTVAVVSTETDLFVSPDAGSTWPAP